LLLNLALAELSLIELHRRAKIRRKINLSSFSFLPECPSYSLVSERNKVLFTKEALARTNGYRKAGNCPE
jgi:hypothetical protein